jgi:hypothetical protein
MGMVKSAELNSVSPPHSDYSSNLNAFALNSLAAQPADLSRPQQRKLRRNASDGDRPKSDTIGTGRTACSTTIARTSELTEGIGKMWTKDYSYSLPALILLVIVLPMSGCASYRVKNLIPACEVLNASCCAPDNGTQINFLTLRLQPPKQYILGPGDTLGIYVEGITGDRGTPPPVYFPEDSSRQPAVGFPVPIREDGMIALPLVEPVRIAGMTLADAELRIRKAYTEDKEILLEGSQKIIVTLMKRRTYNVLVIREDVSDGRSRNSLTRGEIFLDDEIENRSFSIELPAYENDVLHALSETGGLPGERAVNEIYVLRGAMNRMSQDAVVKAIDRLASAKEAPTIDMADVVTIPIKGDVGTFPELSEDDITLESGDIVYIKGREQQVFYTGGLLEGGRFPLPRDYDIDVLEAMSMAGGSISTAGGSSGARGLGVGNIMPATQVTILRKCGCEQIAIDVDLRLAVSDPRERVIVQPGDIIVLEYRPNELAINFTVSLFQFGGIFQVFRN